MNGSESTTITAAIGRPRGRPSAESDPMLRCRNFRWLLTYLVGVDPATIAASEPTPVHPSTVRRGIAAARPRLEMLVPRSDRSEGEGADMALRNT